MTTMQSAPARPRLEGLSALMGLARAVLFAVAIGICLTAPASLPWVIAVVAVTNIVFLIARAAMSDSRPPTSLLILNGLTVTLVIGYAALSSIDL